MFKKFLICVVLSLVYVIYVYADETLTITTYYPSPYGVYKTLRIYPSPAADCTSGVACSNEGEMCYNSVDHALYICGGTPSTWQSGGGAGGYWTLSGTDLYANDTDWNVGIGITTSLLGKLSVSGSSGAGNAAIVGQSSATNAIGVYGATSGSNSTGVQARGTTYGVNAIANTAVYGEGTIGVRALGTQYGVYASSGALGGIAVYAYSNSPWGGAVYGYGDNSVTGGSDIFGVKGVATTTVGSITAYGVYAQGTTYDFYAANTSGKSYFAGNVGIGTTSPDVKLDVDGDIEADLISTGGAAVGYIAGGADGGAYKLTRLVSSRKYKENITDFTLGLEIVKKMRPVIFNWKSTRERDFGFVAEEAEEVNPLLITKIDGKPESFKYMPYTAILTNAIKEQQKEIEDLKSAVAELSRRLETKK